MTEDMMFAGLPHHSNDSYAYAKRLLTFQCGNYNRERGRQYMCVTPTNIYGKYDNYSVEDGHVAPALMHKFLNAEKSGETLSIPTGKDSVRQFIYAKDLARVIKRLIEDQSVFVDNVIVCNDEIKITDVVKKIAAHFPAAKYEILEKEEGIAKKTCSNALLTKTLPDFKFTPFDLAFDRSVRWFKKTYPNVRK
jgi:GDP-L-fucose synthase